MCSYIVTNSYMYNAVANYVIAYALTCVYQRCNRVTSIDLDDPLTHWLRPSDPDVTRIKFF